MKDMNGDNEPLTSADLAQQLTTLRGDFDGLTQIIKDLAATKKDEAISVAQSRMSEAAHVVANQVETARLHGMVLQDRAAGFVRNQPIAAVGIAAGMGVLLGVLANRR
jgi:ElaB/YqjD/DUF883 family membrane-anchored ribosome-binding protein